MLEVAQGKYARNEEPRRQPSAPANPHRRFYIVMSLLTVFVAAMTFCAVVLLKMTAVEGSPSGSSSGGAAVSSDGTSSAPPPEESEPSDGEPAVSAASDGHAAAQEFDKNPIDAALETALGAASTNYQLLTAYDTALNSWKSEIDREMTRLRRHVQDDNALLAEQSKWLQGVEDRLAREYPEQENGSVAALNRTKAEYDAYQARAKELYGRLTVYEPEYSIAA